MGNIVELRELVKDILNNNCVDPYPSDLTRQGNHFFSESEGISFTRGNTFPKGYVTIGDSPDFVKDNVGAVGHIKKYGTLTLYYFSKEKLTYTLNGITYKEKDIINIMLDNICTVLTNNKLQEYHLFPTSINLSSDIGSRKDGTFKIYDGIMTVTYYWYETYGI